MIDWATARKTLMSKFPNPLSNSVDLNSPLNGVPHYMTKTLAGLFLPSPDLYSWRVSYHLEISFIRVKPARVLVIQWGTPFSGEFRSMRFESGFGNLDI